MNANRLQPQRPRAVPEQQQNVHVVGAQHLVLLGRSDQVADEVGPIVRPVLLEDLHETATGCADSHTSSKGKNCTAIENDIVTPLLKRHSTELCFDWCKQVLIYTCV